MKTLNQIKTSLIDWFNSHALINSVYYEDDNDYNAESSIDYPSANLEFIEADIDDNLLTYRFKVVVSDITKADDTEHEDNIHSDAIQICEDMYTWLEQSEGLGYFINSKSNLQKFTDDTDDRASGIYLYITLATIRRQNLCAIPYKPN